MSTYVMADIHGCYTDFMNMLNKIDFKEDDKLIIAGDILDRGPENYEMLKWLEDKPDNVEIIMGNHDEMFIEDVCSLKAQAQRECDLKANYKYISRYDHSFDKYKTVYGLIYDQNVTLGELKKWAVIMADFELIKELNIGGRDYIIVHAGYIDEDCLRRRGIDRKNGEDKLQYMLTAKEQFYVWAKEEALIAGGKKDTTIIAGHTPTISNSAFYTGGTVFKYVNEDINSVIYDIDCGCVFRKKYKEGNLACIRLEDEKIFYLED